MLVLSRMRDEKVLIPISEATVIDRNGDRVRVYFDKPIEVIIVDIRGDKVRLGFTAPEAVPVHREEVYNAINEGAAAVRAERMQRLQTAT